MAGATYDVVVIGAGPVGENVAARVVRGGLTAAVVERELVGGECSYWACMPTKALLRGAAALRAARQVPGAREAVTGELDVAAVLRRRDEFASYWKDSGQVSWLDSAGIALHRGQGRIAADRVVEVTGEDGTTTLLTARHAVVVATGSSALVPDIPGLRAAAPWTSREAAAAGTVPGRLAVIGGGVVASEMATAYAALGSKVTVLARDGVLPFVEPFAAELVTGSLREAGVSVRSGAEAASVTRNGNGTVVVTLAGGERTEAAGERTEAGGERTEAGGERTQAAEKRTEPGAERIEADELLVAVGRTPNTGDLGLDRVGLEPGAWLTVDDTLRVPGVEWLYAAGDVNGRVLLTHQGKYQARAVGDLIVARAGGEPVATPPSVPYPQVIFTDPEVASVGMTAAAAEAAGLRVRVVDHDLAAVAGAALHADGYRGRARMVVDEDRRVIVGVTFAGPDVAELLHAATIAVAGEVPLDRLWHAVPAYPTVSEVWLRLLEAYGL
ncbi:oxidoreductase [Paractinoplanes deccanensis]|uniref:Oxidoreductase n=1 Tax=Paractinoplanes deccanensis TaxID=113561 RepID=A0ABQ3YEC5_9ACTN|nr:NAD(P)/FAD-dependent oxidoreductase [Actinoplanes deccanensis]GID78328.1 oxidoreductase [Actinoplanes deccanensis]